MRKITQIQDVTATELQDMLADTVRAEISELKKAFLNTKSNNEDDLLSPDEVCEMLCITKVTLWNYQKNGKLKAFGIGQKRYYKRSDVLNAIQLKNNL